MVGVRPANKGNLLIRIGSSSNKIFEVEVTRRAESMGQAQRVGQRIIPEIQNLECVTRVEEVQHMLDTMLKAESKKVTVLGFNKQGLKLAVVVIDQEEADRLERLERII